MLASFAQLTYCISFIFRYSSFQPNTYTFTKSLAEHVANDYKDQLPILIYRPSIGRYSFKLIMRSVPALLDIVWV